jgi:hypothetical protein
MTNDDLATLIRSVSAAVDKGNLENVAAAVKPLRAVTCPNAHLGRGDDMDHTDKGFRLQLEWYAGQLLAMVDESQWFGINSWINCADKFTTRKAAP